MPTRVYADTSAIAKLFVAEAESEELRQWLGDRRGLTLISSELLRLELMRMLHVVQPGAIKEADRFLSRGIDLVEITRPVLAHAELMPPRRLRTLDAIHLTTAFDLGPALNFVLSYDKRLLFSARNAGMDTASPGMRSQPGT
jgi:uncharacterized protein